MEHAPRFELENANALLVNMNSRLEKHGEDDKLACDLNFEYETANTSLAMFAPALRSCMYLPPDEGVQGELPVAADYLPRLRFPGLAALKWTVGELIGAKLSFAFGVKSHLDFAGVKVHKYRLELKEGGSVVISFQAQVHPTEAQAGKLAGLFQGKQVVISVEPPAGDPDADIE